MFRFTCACCGEVQDGVPSFAAAAPLHYESLTEDEQRERGRLSGEVCIIDDRLFFVRALLRIPVIGSEDPFVWNIWASLSAQSFEEYAAHYDDPARTDFGPYFCWLSAALPTYPSLDELRSSLHLQPIGQRPLIELAPSDHPLSLEQRQGISAQRLGEIFAACVHGAGG
ncbi:DUF2199 domain-containing protein [Jiella sp. M17.18]|uniref:DUF2199 domain-containing protein n=1 Tax=Jiella sp. M17.18 TaxID=3234247 RepID=UPI0034DEEFCE